VNKTGFGALFIHKLFNVEAPSPGKTGLSGNMATKLGKRLRNWRS